MRKLLAAAIVVVTVGALAPLAVRAAASGPVAEIADDLAVAMDAATADERLMVFVHGRTRTAALAAVEAAGLDHIGEFESIGVPVAVGTAAQVEDLATQPDVTYVEPNRDVELLMETSRTAIRADEAIAHTFSPGVGPYDGSGRTIAIVDGGVDGTHPMFTDDDGSSKVIRNLKVACFNNIPGITFGEANDPNTCPDGFGADPFFVDVTGAGNDSDTMSAGGHGTHVAGTAAGYPVKTSGGHELSGVAPGAKLVSISIGQGIGIYAGNAALDWIVRHAYNPCQLKTPDHVACPPITVVNNSYGSTSEWDPKSATSKLQNKLVDAGIVMVWANGNGDTLGDGGDGSDNRSGSDAQHPRPGVISVANYDDNDSGTRNGSLAPSSSRGHSERPRTWPDVSAPGTSITSACRPYLVICRGSSSDPNYGTISGTSMASPHVAGAVAVMQQANPALSPGQIEEILEDTAHRFQFGAPYWTQADPNNLDSPTSFDKGHGLIDLTAAVGTALGTAGPAASDMACASPLLLDDAGDATDVHTVHGTPLPSEPQLDVVAADLKWDGATSTLVLIARAKDLKSTNPPETMGILYEFVFGHAGAEYFVRATRELDGEQHATLGQFGVGAHVIHVSNLKTTFDPDTNKVTVQLPNAALSGTDVPPFAAGQQLTGFSIVTRRQMGAPKNAVSATLGLPRAVVLQADSGAAGCPFTIGGAAAPAQPQPFTSETDQATATATVDGSVADGKPFSATDVTPTDTSGLPLLAGQHCGGPDAKPCITYRVEVLPEKASTLNVWLQPHILSVALDDFDLHVYDASGARIASSAGPQTILEVNGIYVDVEEPAVYTIVVDPYNVPKDVKFRVHAALYAD